MRLRFTIRDLLWLAVVAALATGWWLDHAKHQPIVLAPRTNVLPYNPMLMYPADQPLPGINVKSVAN